MAVMVAVHMDNGEGSIKNKLKKNEETFTESW